jgi:thymidylate kinase
MKRGLFITIEGTDGSGKTTQIGLIKEYMQNTGYEVLITREPGGTRISERVREIILDPELKEMDAYAEMLLYAAARAQLVAEVVRPALEMGKIVICDRFVDSTYAYQGYGRGLDLDMLVNVNNIAINGVMPDITFFFDLDPYEAIKRRRAASITDRIENEKMDFHSKVHAGYICLAEKFSKRIKRIDCNRTVEEIWVDVRFLLDNILGGDVHEAGICNRA